MRIAIIGTEGSLKRPAAQEVSKLLRIPLEDTPVQEKMAVTGSASCWDARPDELFQGLDAVMGDHKAKVMGSRTAVFPVTTVEILAYHLMLCSGSADPDVSRNAIINCAQFTAQYEHLFLVTLDKDTHDAESGLFFSGNIAQEYAFEYIMRGVLGRFGINYWEIKEKTVEAIISEIIEKV